LYIEKIFYYILLYFIIFYYILVVYINVIDVLYFFYTQKTFETLQIFLRKAFHARKVKVHFRCSRAIDILLASRRNEWHVTRHVTTEYPTFSISITRPAFEAVFNH